MAVFPPAHNKYGPTYAGPRLARRNRAAYPPNATRNASRARSDLGTAKSPHLHHRASMSGEVTGLAEIGIAYHLAEIGPAAGGQDPGPCPGPRGRGTSSDDRHQLSCRLALMAYRNVLPSPS